MLPVFKLSQALDHYDFLEDSEESFLEAVEYQNKNQISKLMYGLVPSKLGILAFDIGISYLLGIGTKIDEKLAAIWLDTAASCALDQAVVRTFFSMLENSLEFEVDTPRRLWSYMSAFSALPRSLNYLRKDDPALHSTISAVVRNCLWGHLEPQNDMLHIEEYISTLISSIRDGSIPVNGPLPYWPGKTFCQESALHLCAVAGMVDFATFLIVEKGADVDATNLRNETPIFLATRAGRYQMALMLLDHNADVSHVNTEGLGIMHCLSIMDDDEAAALVPLYHSRGAKVVQEVPDPICIVADFLNLQNCLPITLAAVRGQECLFSALLTAHKGEKMTPGHVKELLRILCLIHFDGMLEEVLAAIMEITEIIMLSFICEEPSLNNGGKSPTPTLTSVEATPILSVLFDSACQDGVEALKTPQFLSSLLYAALTSPVLTVDFLRRGLHGKEHLLRLRSTISTLLSWGADPLVVGSVHLPDYPYRKNILSTVLDRKDPSLLQLFLEHLETKHVDVLAALRDHDTFGGENALSYTIYHDSYENFLFLLHHYPPLAESSEDDHTILHVAAANKRVEFIRELLGVGIDCYVKNEAGFTPFLWAVAINSNLEVADLLVKDANTKLLLGSNAEEAFTVYVRLLAGIMRMNQPNNLKYLTEAIGLPPFSFDAGDHTLFTILLEDLRPPLTDHLKMDLQARILRYFIELFPKHLDFIDARGKAALHYAAENANVAATRLLLENGANPNILTEKVGHGPRSTKGELTPLDLALWKEQNGPEEFIVEGAMDIKSWQQSLEEVVGLLFKYGSDSGPGAALLVGMRVRYAKAKHAYLKLPGPAFGTRGMLICEYSLIEC